MNDRILRLVESVRTASPKRTLAIVALLIVAAAIPLTLAVTQQQQDTRTQASITNPFPEPTATPSPTPTCTPIPSACTNTSVTPPPTINCNPPSGGWCPTGTTSLYLTLGLDAVGSTGDHVNPSNFTGSNQNPLTQKRNIVVQIFDISNNGVDEINGEVNYNPATGKFEGSVNLKPGFQSGGYTILVKTPRYLRRLYSGIQSITAGTQNNLPLINLIVGDIVENNAIDIQDYNVFISCSIFTKDNGGACTSGSTNYRPFADLNDDGKVDENDYLFLLREWVVQFGDSGPDGCINGALRCTLDQPQKCVNKNWQNNGAKCTGTTPVCNGGICVGPTPTPGLTCGEIAGANNVSVSSISNYSVICSSTSAPGPLMTFNWSATCGQFLAPTPPFIGDNVKIWQSPAAQGSCTLTVQVTSGTNTVTKSKTVTVGTVTPRPTIVVDCFPPLATKCGNICVNTGTDKNNCGVCGTICGSGKVCQNGLCKTVRPRPTARPTSACLAPKKLCGNSCVNLKTDENNCGKCALKCSSGRICLEGLCKSGSGGGDDD